ncbi:MAG: hypothetical protein JJT81_07295 [Rubellimicrobium sp.]|nr:hypothetical protein [Rubellimicrobium sp.]
MISAEQIRGALFEVRLPANTPARLSASPDGDGGPWWRLGGATWIQALPKRSLRIKQPEGDGFAEVRFRVDRAGLEVDEDADWVWEVDEVKGFAARLLLEILRQLDASVPVLPVRAAPRPPDVPQLDWPGGGPALPEVRRRSRTIGSSALSSYLDQVERYADARTTSDPAAGLVDRLIRHLSVIPRPAETLLSLSWNDPEEAPVLSWEYRGSPELLWGASEISFGEGFQNVAVAALPPCEREERLRLGAFGQILAMASAFEAATGGLSIPLELNFRTAHHRRMDASFTVTEEAWGFDIPWMVLKAGQGHVPDGLSLRNAG